MKLHSICLLVSDFSVALRFWRDVMKVPVTFSDESIPVATFDGGSAMLVLYPRDQFGAMLDMSMPVPAGHKSYVAWAVEDVDVAYTNLVEQGVTSIAGPQDRPLLMARTAHIADPDGNIIELFSSLPTGTTSTV